MLIPNYNPVTNNAFTSGSRNPKFIASSFDYSCVGIVHTSPRDKVVTAVGDQEVVAAVHYGLAVGQVIDFVNTSGHLVTAKVLKVQATHGDIQVLEVDQMWSAVGVKPATIARSVLIGAQTLVFGENASDVDLAAFGHAGYIIPGAGGTVYMTAINGSNYTLEPGDSGAPDFLVSPGGLTLLGVHYAVLPGLSLTSLLYPFNY